MFFFSRECDIEMNTQHARGGAGGGGVGLQKDGGGEEEDLFEAD